MNDQIREIAKRLYGLRDALGLTPETLAGVCNLTEKEYLEFESGMKDIPIGVLQAVSKQAGIDVTALLFGEDPKVSEYYLTRSGTGTAMERRKAYKYESLAAGFSRRKADPYIVTVEPKPDCEELHANSHSGQEFNYVLEGILQLTIDGKVLVLNEGDSIYFDASQKHCMKAMHGKKVRFLAVVI